MSALKRITALTITRLICAIRFPGMPAPGYEPEVEASQHYAIVEMGWFDLRDEASWGEKLVNDRITYTLMCKLRAALGYAGELPDTLPSTSSISAMTL